MKNKKIEQAIKALPAKSSKELKEFTKNFFAHVSDEDMKLLDVRTMVNTAMVHFDMYKKRKKGEVIVNVHTPSLDSKDKDWDIGRTIIDFSSDDMVFLIDSITASLTRKGYSIYLLFNSHIDEKNGKVHIHIQLKNILHKQDAKSLENILHCVVDDVSYATRDWRAMREEILKSKESLKNAPKKYPIEEYKSFLDYLYNDNFTLLGYRKYNLSQKKDKVISEIIKGESLGVLSDEKKPVYINFNRDGLSDYMQELRMNMPPVTVSKINKRSTVHRCVPMDAIAVKRYDDKGNVIGENIFVGLFTSVTYSRSVEDIPLLSHKVNRVMEISKFRPNSHEYRALKHILEKYPRDELFQISEEDLFEICKGIMRLQERKGVALYTRPDPFGRYVSCLVYIPRDRFNTNIRIDIQKILESELNGKCTNFHTTLDDSPLARVLFIISKKESDLKLDYDRKALESKIQEASRSWSEKFADTIYSQYKVEDKSLYYIKRYSNAFTVAYQDRFKPHHAVMDIEKIEEVIRTGKIALQLFRPKDITKVRLKIYNKDNFFALSDILPILQNMGLRVISEIPYKISPEDVDCCVWINDFRMEILSDKHVEIKDIKDIFVNALSAILDNRAENDSLNQLAILGNMTWREISIIRMYLRYLRQANLPYSLEYMQNAITENPHIARKLADLFKTRHNHELKGSRDKKYNNIKNGIENDLQNVHSLDFDRIIKSVVSVIDATLRTNYFLKDSNGNKKSYISVKIDSKSVSFLPNPKPYREIYVYSPKIEGIHLRGDKVARGGLRWSDRHEDFRTEILDLMKAQMVKNAVIVPMGSKGGFVVKQPPKEGGRDAYIAEGIECYKTFLRGLLDITDNRKGNKVIPPKGIVRIDGDDPYLVVAADKGTATFSDIANSISLDYDFWLGDAFASGGSAGYDHKKMGITARGAWESVKRHFRELNHNTQTTEFDVIGVGDMGGDVFGNGMLLSDKIKLIGAFNHLHIFCDPNPDVAVSFAERKRLFDNVKGWDEYNLKKLSKGGRIFNRSDKSLKLTEEIKKKFNITEDELSPNDLIRYMLKAKVDLLWFGGIGTYIKSSKESNSDVGDKTNDILRINANELRAKVIGEGANLAITQAARIEFAKNGGKVNADFIDNSGGVDSSDHEVNIKILFTDIMEDSSKGIDISKRNKILEQMTDEIVEHVLRNNYQQAQAISLMELNAVDNLQHHSEFIEKMEKAGVIDRELEVLPSEEEIEEIKLRGKGLTRPEISVLQAYAKIELTKELLKTDVPDNDHSLKWLLDYFPSLLHKKYAKEINKHMLKREIIATTMSNGLVNRLGLTFVQEKKDKTGASVADIAVAYFVVKEAFDLKPIFEQIEALDYKIPAKVQLCAMNEISKTVEREVIWFLTRLGRDIDLDKDVKLFSGGVRELKKTLNSSIDIALGKEIDMRVKAWQVDGLPEELAKQIALMPVLSSAFDIIRIANDRNAPIKHTAKIYFELGEYFHINWLRKQAKYIKGDTKWSSDALDGIIDHLYGCQAGLTISILNDEKTVNERTVSEWLAKRGHQAVQIKEMFDEIRKNAKVDLSILVIAEQRLRNLYGG